MTNYWGMAGRRARSLALDRMQVTGSALGPAPAPSTTPEDPLPLVQRAAANSLPAKGAVGAPSSDSTAMGAEEIERETPSPSPEEVADRVYQLLCQDLRWERERRGRW